MATRQQPTRHAPAIYEDSLYTVLQVLRKEIIDAHWRLHWVANNGNLPLWGLVAIKKFILDLIAYAKKVEREWKNCGESDDVTAMSATTLEDFDIPSLSDFDKTINEMKNMQPLDVLEYNHGFELLSNEIWDGLYTCDMSLTGLLLKEYLPMQVLPLLINFIEVYKDFRKEVLNRHKNEVEAKYQNPYRNLGPVEYPAFLRFVDVQPRLLLPNCIKELEGNIDHTINAVYVPAGEYGDRNKWKLIKQAQE